MLISCWKGKTLRLEAIIPDHYICAAASFAAVVRQPRNEIDDPGYPPSRSLVLMSRETMQRLQRFAGKGRFCIDSAMASSVTVIPILKITGEKPHPHQILVLISGTVASHVNALGCSRMLQVMTRFSVGTGN